MKVVGRSTLAGNRLKKSSNILVVNLPTQNISHIFCWDGYFGEGRSKLFDLFLGLLDTGNTIFGLHVFVVLELVTGMFFPQDQWVGSGCDLLFVCYLSRKELSILQYNF